LDAAAEIATTCSHLAACTNANLASDLAIAIDLACVAARAAAHNVEVNLPSVTDDGDRNARRAAMTRALTEAAAAGARHA
jgi:formiminotetrahydrofolate cyclodeaminase